LGARVVALAVAVSAGCAGSKGPPAIRVGTACTACGMEVHDLRFACERARDSGKRNDWRVYDAIECLIRDQAADSVAAAKAGHDVWLADYDRASLHPADSLWVVRGSFPSPMGGGFAAFLSRPAADSVAAATQGRVERLAAWLAAGPDKPPAVGPDRVPAEPDKAPTEPDEASK
jgi:hypothetical protein